LQGLSIILRYQGELETAVSHLKTALVMDRKLQDRISEAGTLLNLGVFMANLGDNATARKYHQQSLPIFRQIGDRQGEAFALINMADVDLNTGDYLAAINLTRQTLQISQEIGDQNLEAFNLMGLGVMYAHLGMWSKSESFLADALACCQAMDDLRGQSHVLGNWSLLETWRGHNEAALQRGREATEMARRARDHQVLAYALTSLAHALASRQTWAEAEAAYNEAIALRESSGEHHLAIENVAGLAFVALAQGDMAQATRLADKIWRYLQNASLDGTDDRFGVYWACYRVWVAAKDERAPIILAQAVAELQALADKIEDDNVRQSFLNNIPSRRHIMAAWVSKAAHT
jgi:tetratricopeptide (TPR) repeat protein